VLTYDFSERGGKREIENEQERRGEEKERNRGDRGGKGKGIYRERIDMLDR
jgi:hypothetical protein